jgi:hypothetical protein
MPRLESPLSIPSRVCPSMRCKPGPSPRATASMNTGDSSHVWYRSQWTTTSGRTSMQAHPDKVKDWTRASTLATHGRNPSKTVASTNSLAGRPSSDHCSEHRSSAPYWCWNSSLRPWSLQTCLSTDSGTGNARERRASIEILPHRSGVNFRRSENVTTSQAYFTDFASGDTPAPNRSR